MIIKNEKFKDTLLAALGDREVVKILRSVLFQSKSMADISKETVIPQTTVFRKIKWMLENRLLVIEKMNITKDGKKTSLFRSIWKTISAKFDNGIMHVEVQQNVNQSEIITKKMFSLDPVIEE